MIHPRAGTRLERAAKRDGKRQGQPVTEGRRTECKLFCNWKIIKLPRLSHTIRVFYFLSLRSFSLFRLTFSHDSARCGATLHFVNWNARRTLSIGKMKVSGSNANGINYHVDSGRRTRKSTWLAVNWDEIAPFLWDLHKLGHPRSFLQLYHRVISFGDWRLIPAVPKRAKFFHSYWSSTTSVPLVNTLAQTLSKLVVYSCWKHFWLIRSISLSFFVSRLDHRPKALRIFNVAYFTESKCFVNPLFAKSPFKLFAPRRSMNPVFRAVQLDDKILFLSLPFSLPYPPSLSIFYVF